MLKESQVLQTELTATQALPERRRNPLMRRIWLPKILYDLVPWFYLASGIVALLGALYINDWFWIVPQYFIFAAACVHAGYYIHRLRKRRAKSRR